MSGGIRPTIWPVIGKQCGDSNGRHVPQLHLGVHPGRERLRRLRPGAFSGQIERRGPEGRKDDPYSDFVESALRLRRERLPKNRRVSVASIQELLLSAASAFPLVTIHREAIDPDVCWIVTCSGAALLQSSAELEHGLEGEMNQ
jgi:hypothetical protein